VRQDTAIAALARRVDASPWLVGALLIGSFATRDADELSDVDVIVVVVEGRFEQAWARRAELHAEDALSAFDDVDPDVPEIGAHKWLTRDLVFFDCLLATPSSGVRLADPARLLTGPADLAERLPRRPRFARADLEAYANARRAAGRTSPVEDAYHALKEAVRRAR
jgi:predicted nucleotidyltransferase